MENREWREESVVQNSKFRNGSPAKLRSHSPLSILPSPFKKPAALSFGAAGFLLYLLASVNR